MSHDDEELIDEVEINEADADGYTLNEDADSEEVVADDEEGEESDEVARFEDDADEAEAA